MKIYGQEDLIENQTKLLKQELLENPSNVDVFHKLNKLYLLKGMDDRVKYNLRNYPDIKSEYNRIILSPMYYKNELTISGSIFKSPNYFGKNGKILYQHNINGVNQIGFSFQQESRDFKGVLKRANLVSVEYKRKVNYDVTYIGSISYSPSNSFYSEFSFLNMFYFNLFKNNSSFIGLINSAHKNQKYNNTLFIGNEYYNDNSIYHITLYGLKYYNDFLPSISLAHTYYFSYREEIKNSVSFGKSLDDYKLFGNFFAWNTRYSYTYERMKPFIELNMYNSKFINEIKIGGGVQWKF